MIVRSFTRWLHQSSTKVKPKDKGIPKKPKHNAFTFGKFSQLSPPPSQKSDDSSSKLVKKPVSATMDSLLIFPTVRQAMEKEIKEKYSLKSTYVKSIDDVEIIPSPIQAQAIPIINSSRINRAKSDSVKIQRELEGPMRVFTMAAETGSGKTWAYLASVLSRLKKHDYDTWRTYGVGRYQQEREKPLVRAIILVPTNELVDQVYDTIATAALAPIDPTKVPKQYQEFAALESTLGLSVFSWGSTVAPTELFKELKKGRVDVVVTTPAKITALSKLKNIHRPFKYFSQVKYCVVDEADTLFDKSWFDTTTNIVTRLGSLEGLILCSATIPREFSQKLKELFPNKGSVIEIASPDLHKLPKQVHFKVIDASERPYNNQKIRALAQCLYAIQRDGTDRGYVKRVVVFVNERDEVGKVVKQLIENYQWKPQDVLSISGNLSPDQRSDMIRPFVSEPEQTSDTTGDSSMKVLVTTDLLARGINFRSVKNVILMDLPNNSVDLVHRVGRTGRMRQAGRVFFIVDRKTRRSFAKGIPKAVRSGQVIG
ncbi:hypothetical protein DIURU_000492 [Diutina rugosa]|uniref:ATP-dependent RNA helicase n=1 Tax=Diutina rugosa TaxID=5481 RepID=A0A642V4T5_DIURU|nr:uncharacterized protein DIURU_000492 [Diutina rugosa]KAA8907805.1 hypothetical protein DIURU_000492 [Diutina rugosa]